MLGGVLIAASGPAPGETALAIIGVLALLIGASELAARWLADRSTQAELRRHREALAGRPSVGCSILSNREQPPPPDAPCVFPRLDPELEQLRRKGAL